MYLFIINIIVILNCSYLNEFIRKVPSLQDADETRNIVVTVFLVA